MLIVAAAYSNVSSRYGEHAGHDTANRRPLSANCARLFISCASFIKQNKKTSDLKLEAPMKNGKTAIRNRAFDPLMTVRDAHDCDSHHI